MVETDFRVTNIGTIRDISYRDDLVLADTDQDRKNIIDSLPLKIWDYFDKNYYNIHGYSFFVKAENGEYKEIYAFDGFIPYLNKWLLKIEWWFKND